MTKKKKKKSQNLIYPFISFVSWTINLLSSNAKESAPCDVRSSSVIRDICERDLRVIGGVGVIVKVSGCASGIGYSCSVR